MKLHRRTFLQALGALVAAPAAAASKPEPKTRTVWRVAIERQMMASNFESPWDWAGPTEQVRLCYTAAEFGETLRLYPEPKYRCRVEKTIVAF